MNMKKLSAILVLALALSLVFCSCASSGKSSYASYDTAASEDSYPQSNSASSDYDFKSESSAQNYSDAQAAAEQYGLKIVYTSTLNIETKEFDSSVEAITGAISSAGGYLSYTQTGGGTSYNGYYSNRWAQYTARIPADRYEAFMAGSSAFGNVTSTDSSSEDITSQYIDVEARLSSLKEQETRLLELLEQSGSLEDLLAIEEKLSDVRYQIESYTSTINTYDDLVNFCTVTIYLNEVRTSTSSPAGFTDEIKSAIAGSAEGVVNFLKSLLLGLIYALPYLVILAVVVLIIVKAVKRHSAKRAAKPAAAQQMPTA
jgi:hypothetical protein